MYSKEILIEEERFLDTVEGLIKIYKEAPKSNYITTVSTLTKEHMIERIKTIGKIHWIDEELIQDQINKL